MRRVLLVVAAALFVTNAGRLHAQGPGDPILPQATVDTAYPPNLLSPATKTPATAAALTAALASAVPGDVIELLANVAYEGTFVLPASSGSGWIVIRTSNFAGIPAAGVRADKSQAGAMPKLLSTTNNVPALKTTSGATHTRKVWLAGLEIGLKPGVTSTGNTLQLGAGNEISTSDLPENVVVDRCYVHGNTIEKARHGITLNGRSMAIIDSYVANFHDFGSGDSQAIIGYNGAGPFKIRNNYIEAAGENVLFGGNDSTIENLVPSDIEVTRNSFDKPLAWKQNDPSFAGQVWTIKNLFELKNAQRVLVDGNVFQHTWTGGQGYAITLTVRNQSGTNAWATVQDVTFTNNTVLHAPGGVAIIAVDDNHPGIVATRIRIANNVFDDISTAWDDGVSSAAPTGYAIHITGRVGTPWPDFVTFDHNTFFVSGKQYIFVDGNVGATLPSIPNFRYTNNIQWHNERGVFGSNSGIDTPAFTGYLPTALTFSHNIVEGTRDNTPTGATWASNYNQPGRVFANMFPKTWGEVYTDMSSYTLDDASAFKGGGSDGQDPGVDMAALNAAQSGNNPPSSFFTDNFNDNVLDGGRWIANAVFSGVTDPAIAVDEKNQHLEIGPLPAGASGNHYNGIRTKTTYNLTDAYASVRLVQAAAPAATASYAVLTVGVDADNYYRIWVAGTSLVCEREIATVKTDQTPIAYVPGTPLYLRIRHESTSGHVVYETAPDAGGGPGTWTTRCTDSWNVVAVPVTAVYLELKAGVTGSQTTPGPVVFDDFATGPMAPTETLVAQDSFDGPQLNAQWQKVILSGSSDPNIPVDVNGTLNIGPLVQTTSTSRYFGVSFVNPTNFTNTYAYVQAAVPPPPSTTADLMFTLVVDAQNHYRIYVEHGLIKAEKKIADTKTLLNSPAPAFSPTNHAYWRIRHDTSGGVDNMVFEAGPAPNQFPTTLAIITRELAITGVKPELKAGTYQNEATAPGTVSFDNFRMARPQ